ncbi:hypothetical protein N0V84_001217 [Fusarium piperis]|uniref:2EXR domain-containing protein n=1 Tax=Fusarium piperis TaxID=1435070 RepID=A0A9W8WLI4_9HYPO|nr:hypothetical protein N0V84_001217 [Fusarium piperis]
MSFNQLPLELRLEIWHLCMTQDQDRYLILGVSLAVAMSHRPGSRNVEQVVVGGSFVPAWPDHALPVHPVESQLTIQALGGLCSESRAVVLEHFPDCIRLEKNALVLGNCRRLTHDHVAWERAGCRPERFFLRCNLKTDILWAHSAAPARRIHSHSPVEYALGIYELIKDIAWGPVNADIFTKTLKSVKHAVVSMPLSMEQEASPHHTPRIQELLIGMPLLDTLAVQVGRFPEPFKRTKTTDLHSIPDVRLLYRPLSYRCINPIYHTLQPSRFYTAVKDFKTRTSLAEHSHDFYEMLDLRLGNKGLNFEDPEPGTILNLRKKPKAHVEKWLREKKEFGRWMFVGGTPTQECDSKSMYLPDQFTMVASDEEILAASRGKNMGTWIVR